jgi:hypothetical protein
MDIYFDVYCCPLPVSVDSIVLPRSGARATPPPANLYGAAFP